MATQFPVGSRRLSKGDVSASAGATRDVRRQMAAIQKNFQRLIDSVDGVTEEAVREGLQPIYDESQIFVPVDTGTLKASGFIETRRTSKGVSGVVGYAAGSNPPYAAIVHERLDTSHATPTQAKFLELAVMRNFDEFRSRIVTAMKRGMGFGR